MPAAAFELRHQLGEIVMDNPPLNLFSEGLIADLRADAEQAAVSEARAVLLRAGRDDFAGTPWHKHVPASTEPALEAP